MELNANSFQVKFRKTYASDAEELKRREIWEKNIANIDKHNEEFKEGKHSYTLAENKYADMVWTHIKQIYY